MLPALYRLASSKKTGTINMTNPGLITHNEILELYKKLVDPSIKWELFSVEEQDEILKCQRSNCQMDSALLQKMCPEVGEVKQAVSAALNTMAKSRKIPLRTMHEMTE